MDSVHNHLLQIKNLIEKKNKDKSKFNIALKTTVVNRFCQIPLGVWYQDFLTENLSTSIVH